MLEEGDVGMRLTQENAGRKEECGKREMITPALREALAKQGEVLQRPDGGPGFEVLVVDF